MVEMNRRTVLAGLPAVAAACSADKKGAPLMELSTTELAGEIAAGRVSAVEAAEAFLEAAERLRFLNTLTVWDAAGLRAAAEAADADLKRGASRGPLHGVPVVLKDNINTAHLPTSGGTPALKGNRPQTNAPVAARLVAAGALIAGKANLHELSSGGTSANHTFGEVGNPYAPDRTPGGSSGGVAAAVAARIAPAGIGTDTAGSVRLPAAMCGVAGFRPTVGRYPKEGIVPLSESFDTAGPIARGVDDLILLDSVLAGRADAGAAPPVAALRLGIAEQLIEASSSDVSDVVAVALKRLSDAGATLVPVDLAEIRELGSRSMGGVIDKEFRTLMASYLAAHAPEVSVEALVDDIASSAVQQFTRERLDREITDAAYAAAVGPHRAELETAWAALIGQNRLDAVLFPTAPDIALPRVGDDSVTRNGEDVFSWFYFAHTSLGSAGRRPGASLPAGLSVSGLPVGLELDGLPGEDGALLAVARAVETVLRPTPAPSLA